MGTPKDLLNAQGSRKVRIWGGRGGGVKQRAIGLRDVPTKGCIRNLARKDDLKSASPRGHESSWGCTTAKLDLPYLQNLY